MGSAKSLSNRALLDIQSQAEIAQHDLTAAFNKNIGRFDIAVNYTMLVSKIQSAANGRHQFEVHLRFRPAPRLMYILPRSAEGFGLRYIP